MLTSRLPLRKLSLTALSFFVLFIWSGPGGAVSVQAQNRAYVTNLCNDTVSVVDTDTNAIIATIPVGQFPDELAAAPDGTRVYVANRSGSISVIDTATNTVVDTIPVSGPNGIAVTPDGTRLWVVGDVAISIIDTATDTVIAAIPAVDSRRVAITPDGTRAYVTHTGGQDVLVFDTATNDLITQIVVGFGPLSIAITPDGSRAYVGTVGEAAVKVIDTATNTLIDTIHEQFGPVDLAISPDGARVYVTFDLPHIVSVIDTSTNTPITDIHLTGGPLSIALTPDGSRFYTTDSRFDFFEVNKVDVGDTTTNTQIDAIPGFSCPSGIVIAQLPPRTKADCKDSGFQRFTTFGFSNQGQCVKYVNEHAK